MKKLFLGILLMVCCITFSACELGSTTMDQGHDTDGRAGENNTDIKKDVERVMDDAAEGLSDAGREMRIK